MIIDILAVGAHPDDIEIGTAATLIKHVKGGKKIALCDLTYAELSSNGNVETRQQEALLAAKLMGIETRVNLGIKDRNIAINDQNIRLLVEVIRKYKPKVLLAPYWEDRHPDHVHASQLVQEAVFSAGIYKFAPELGQAHKILSVYYYFINDFVDPTFCVNVSSYQDQKQQVLAAYHSQFAHTGESVQTPLNSGYFEQVRSREYLFGRKIHCEYAEGFICRGSMQIESFC